ncbi:hypothetical protein PVNG_06448 [Plasmodium vivax North Korean]|uniref:Variable surface protein n=1 Tax=Plasmodium vivax North Korean TaxID=1035514 RepID=A0A0J9W6E8_PLAVI|nr:hypothetical protein PVNG_06448 [Plasmodium vivax North Korean]
MAYLDELDRLDNSHYSDNKVIQGCIYLYFWIYEIELHKSIFNKNIVDIYKKLLNEYDQYNDRSNIKNICSEYIKDELSGNLKNLYYLYYKFYKIKTEKECTITNCRCAEDCAKLYMECISSCDKDTSGEFCEKLEKFRSQYNEFMKKYDTCDKKYTYLPSAIKFDRKAILISVLVILTIIFTFFGLYKVNINFN